MLKSSGDYLLSHTLIAAAFVLLFSVIPFGGWLSLVIVVLFTLETGPKAGFCLLLVAMVYPITTLFLAKSYVESAISLLTSDIYLWCMAWILRRKTWTWVWESTIVLCLVMVVLVHLLMPNVNGWWETVINNFLHKLLVLVKKLQTLTPYLGMGQDSGSFTWSDIITQMIGTNVAKKISLVATGLTLITLVLGSLFNVGLGHFWQLIVKNQRGFSRELNTTRLCFWFGILGLLIGLATYLWGGVFWDCLAIIIIGYLVVGLMLLHSLLRRIPFHSVIIVVLYIGIILKPIYGLSTLVVLGWLDSFVNFRNI